MRHAYKLQLFLPAMFACEAFFFFFHWHPFREGSFSSGQLSTDISENGRIVIVITVNVNPAVRASIHLSTVSQDASIPTLV